MLATWSILRDYIRYRAMRRDLVKWCEAPDWTDADAAGLRLFLNSETGRKFGATVKNGVLLEASKAVSEDKGLIWKAGYASGFRGLAVLIEMLAQQRVAQEPDSTGSHDHLNP